MSGSENDAEDTKYKCGKKTGMGRRNEASAVERRGNVGIAGDDGESGGNCFQLQGDVGHHAEDGDNGDNCAEPLRLSVAGADEVGNGGDVVCLADPDDFSEEEPPAEHGQRGSEVDREESHA